MFDSGRLAHLHRHLSTLTDVYGGRTTMAVNKSLDYWRTALLDAAILSGQRERTPGESRTHRRSEWAQGVWTRDTAEIQLDVSEANIEQERVLFAALGQQADNWYDLLTLRRGPEAFPVTGIISNLLAELAAQEWADVQQAGRSLLGSLFRGPVLVLVAIAFVLFLLPAVAQPFAAGGAAAIGGVLAGWYGALVGRRSTQPGEQQASAVARVERQVQQLGHAVTPAVQQVAPHGFDWQALVQAAAADVVNQIRLEEIYLGVSEPLARYVVSPAANTGTSDVVYDPRAAARRFLSIMYDSTPNIDRLGSVFQALYRTARQ
jgi:hypothetical protein